MRVRCSVDVRLRPIADITVRSKHDVVKIDIVLSYAQLCVFDAELEQPYNDWDDAHTAQGFSWRPGSVSFAVENSIHSVAVDVTVRDLPPDLVDSSTAIRVPFDVPPSGRVEVGSIMSGVEVAIPPGRYALYCIAPRSDDQAYHLSFVTSGDLHAEVLTEGATAHKQQVYEMAARAA